MFKDNTYKTQTERIYKVPLCIQDTIPIYRISKGGIFELEKKKGTHLFDRMYLFEDINFSTQDEDEKEATGAKFETLLRSMNVSYKIIVSNHYADNDRLREAILHKAVSKEMEPLAQEYHKLLEERLRALHSFYRMGEEKAFSFDWNEYLKLRRDWRNDIINTSLREHKDYLEMEDGKCACTLFVRRYANGLTDQFLNEMVLVYKCGQEKLNNLYYQMKEQRRCSTWRKIKNLTLRNLNSRLWICIMPEGHRIHNWNVNMA